MRRPLLHAVLFVALLLMALPQAQAPAPTAPLRLVSPTARRSITTVAVGPQEYVVLGDLASFFGLALTEDTRTRSLTVTTRGKTALASADQARVMVDGRAITLSGRITRAGDRWLVPVEFIPRVIGPLIGQRVEVRESRFVIVGTARVPRVTSRVEAAGGVTRAVIDIVPASTVSTTVEARRVLVRVEGQALDVAPPAAGSLPAPGVDQITQGDQASVIAVVLTAAAARPRVSAAGAGNGMRVTVEVAVDDRRVPEAPAVQSSAPSPPAPLPAPPPAVQTSIPPAPQVSPAPPAPARARGPVIVIDAGHGGDDVGVRAGEVTEKTLTLALARHLAARLEQRLGIRVVLTRTDDVASDLDARAAAANGARGELFVSLHAGASRRAAPDGVDVFYHQAAFDDAQARRDGTPGSTSLPVPGAGPRVIEFVPWLTAQAAHADTSAALAAALDDALRRDEIGGARGIRRAPLRLLASVAMPAVLVEIGSLGNAAFAARAADDAYQGALADALADGIGRFRQRPEERRPR